MDCKKNETKYEEQLREKNKTFKEEMEEFELEKKEVDNEIIKKEKDNKNYDEKIGEWENHLKELKLNNEELMETYIFNTLKLNQMNQLLTDNENKISIKEKFLIGVGKGSFNMNVASKEIYEYLKLKNI